jgi:hypothetical protein
MVNAPVKRAAAVLLAALLYISSDSAAGEQADGKVLSLENVTTACYALGGDVTTLRDPIEAIYISKGDTANALFRIKEILIEGKREEKSFKVKDTLCIIIFRGFFPGLSKVLIRKVVLKDCEFGIYADYWNALEYLTPSQPAAIIPVGQLPPGDYHINLFVGNEFHKKAEFKVVGR